MRWFQYRRQNAADSERYLKSFVERLRRLEPRTGDGRTSESLFTERVSKSFIERLQMLEPRLAV